MRFLAALLATALFAAASEPPQDVLVLYSFNRNLPAQARVTSGLEAVMEAHHQTRGQFHHEYLDINPPWSPLQRQHLGVLLADKYAGVRFALIITVFDPAWDFLAREGAALSPGTPLLALFGQEAGRPGLTSRPCLQMPARYQLRGTLEQALALFPGTRKVLVVSGSAPSNLRIEAQAKADLAPWNGRLEFTYTSGWSVPEILERAAQLPRDAIILYTVVSADRTGRIHVPTDVANALARQANAPVFGILANFLGEGMLGGVMVDPEAAGALAGEAVLSLRQGRLPDPPAAASYVRPTYDWQALQRWGCNLGVLPGDSHFIHRPPSLWAQFRSYVILTTLAIAVLAALSVGLLVVNRRRALAEAALLESERFLREAQEAGLVGSFVWEIERDTFRISGGLAGLFPAGAEGPSPRWLARLQPEVRDRVAGELGAALAGGQGFDLDFPVPGSQDGELRWVHGRGKVERDRAGKPRKLLGTLQDITERRQVEQERQRMQEELQHTQKLESLGSLAGGIAHDMNNVLAAIQAVAQTLLFKHREDAHLTEALATIDRASTRGRDLVRGLTHFARKGLRDSEVLNLNDLVQEQSRLMQRTLLQRVQVREHLDPDCPAIRGEASALGSALMNLCINAGDAMPKGGTLTLSTARLPGDWAQVQVADTGEGMPPEVQRRALEPFFTTKGVGKGTGLGLAMVYNTVKAHGGSVEIRSEVGMGTAIVLKLPGLPQAG